jgi:SAM-dependent methyltransferase
VGLFDTLASLAPSTSQQIAEAAGLQERYVREWLGALVTGRIVEHDPLAETYALPPEHAAWLTRAAGPNNLAVVAQFMPLLAQVEQPLIESFRLGGGVPYAAYPRFQPVMAELSGAGYDSALIQTVLPLVPGLVAQLQAGIDVLEVGCGSGHALNLMAQAFPNSRFTGYDLAEDGIAAAWAEAKARRLANVRFAMQDAAHLQETNQYDFATAFDAIHDQVYPTQVVHSIARALRTNGAFLMVDIRASSRLAENLDLPTAPFLYTVSCMHCMTVSLAHGGEGLGAMWGEQKASQILREAGFVRVEVKQLASDTGNNYYIATKA